MKFWARMFGRGVETETRSCFLAPNFSPKHATFQSISERVLLNLYPVSDNGTKHTHFQTKIVKIYSLFKIKITPKPYHLIIGEYPLPGDVIWWPKIADLCCTWSAQWSFALRNGWSSMPDITWYLNFICICKANSDKNVEMLLNFGNLKFDGVESHNSASKSWSNQRLRSVFDMDLMKSS